jgi:hypothetical protein
MKRFLPVLVLAFLTVASSTAANPVPNTTITLINELPATMNVGDVATIEIQVSSDQEFISVTALPSFQYPGKGVVAVQGGSRAGSGTFATLELTFQAKSSTARMTDGVAPVYVVVGVRYPGGFVATERFAFYVTVP